MYSVNAATPDRAGKSWDTFPRLDKVVEINIHDGDRFYVLRKVQSGQERFAAGNDCGDAGLTGGPFADAIAQNAGATVRSPQESVGIGSQSLNIGGAHGDEKKTRARVGVHGIGNGKEEVETDVDGKPVGLAIAFPTEESDGGLGGKVDKSELPLRKLALSDPDRILPWKEDW